MIFTAARSDAGDVSVKDSVCVHRGLVLSSFL